MARTTMAVAKKGQERTNYAWMYVAQARKDGKGQAVPAYWQELTDAWLRGFDGVSLVGTERPKPVSDQLEAELDEAAVESPPTE